jgi:ribosome-binding factor A
MASPRRRERLASLIEQVLSEVIRNELKDPRVAGLPSITRVELTADARIAKVYVSVMGSEDERRATFQALEHATGFLRTRLGEEMTIRHVPELHFVLDRSIERGDRVLALLHSLQIPPEPLPATPPPVPPQERTS